MSTVNREICNNLQSTNRFQPINCFLCSMTVWRKRADCPNWQKWLEGCSVIEVKEAEDGETQAV